MGCFCFNQTWWPSYDSDVIDPNKEFDFQRRMKLLKKAIISLVVLAAVALSIYFVVTLISGGSDPNCPPNSTLAVTNASSLTSTRPETSALNQEGPQLNSGPDHSRNASTTPNHIQPGSPTPPPQNKSTEEEMLNGILESNSSIVSKEDIPSVLKHSNLAIFNYRSVNANNATNDSEGATTTGQKNHLIFSDGNSTEDRTSTSGMGDPPVGGVVLNETLTNPSPAKEEKIEGKYTKIGSKVQLVKPDDLRSWCSSKHNAIECVALSKNFRTITTFLNNSSKPHGDSVEGYVMIKTDSTSGLWHPYCSPSWNLEMGYKLCRGLGYDRLHKLETIEISKLKERVTKLGKEIAFQRLAVLPDKTGASENPSQLQSDFSCDVGFISCN